MENEIDTLFVYRKSKYFKRIKTNLQRSRNKRHRKRPLLRCLNRHNPCTCMLSIQKNIENIYMKLMMAVLPGGDFHCHCLDQSLVRKQILQVVQHDQKEKKKERNHDSWYRNQIVTFTEKRRTIIRVMAKETNLTPNKLIFLINRNSLHN